jgi:HEAT repeat protein
MAGNREFDNAIQSLQEKQSAKRRSGAKKLRRMKLKEAGPYLITALNKEIADSRTWETQYQLIMAIGECEVVAAAPLLRQLARQSFDATMIYMAVGDALVRLANAENLVLEPVIDELIESRNAMLIEGGLRAIAMLRLVLDQDLVKKLLDHVSRMPSGDERTDWSRLWVAAAAPGWAFPEVTMYLKECIESEFGQLKLAATAALQGKYRKWSPL